MTFSIIIPVYNTAPYLRECLDSVLAAARALREKCEARSEKCGGVEVFCIDDGSTDGSGVILDAYAEKVRTSAIPHSSFSLPHFTVVHQPHAGSSAARNAGLDRAQGEWIWFVDSDDTIEADALSTFADMNPKADVNYFSMRLQYKDGTTEDEILSDSGVVSETAAFDALAKSMVFGTLGDVLGRTCAKFIRRSIIEEYQLRFDETISCFEDEVFTIGLLEKVDSISTMSKILYNYRKLDTGLTARGIPDHMALAKAYLKAGGDLRRDSICKLVDYRVTQLLRAEIGKSHSFHAASLLFETKDRVHPRLQLTGPYNSFLRLLSKLPKSCAALVLICIHFIRRRVQN